MKFIVWKINGHPRKIEYDQYNWGKYQHTAGIKRELTGNHVFLVFTIQTMQAQAF
jgi:hypothetical protein